MLQRFDETRKELKPYGLTCELWKPKLMGRPDRHNEIEINFFPEGSLTYLMHGQKVKVNKGGMLIFWALFPHQIVDFEEDRPYYVVTIPFCMFLGWNLPKKFLDLLFSGNLKSNSYKPENQEFDIQLFQRWLKDLGWQQNDLAEISALEIQALVRRVAHHTLNSNPSVEKLQPLPINLVEQMAVFISTNFTRPIKVTDVAKAVDLHPDYANVVFKKAFSITISSFITEQRVLFAQRKLMVTQNSITSIAYDAGFSSISRFNASFRKHCEKTPREYRKNMVVLT